MQEINLKGLNETIYYEKLSNGLKVYMWVKKDINTFYGTLSVKYGSIFNKFQIRDKVYDIPKGVAHFLEHVKFNEGKDKTAHDYFFKMGSDANAFTTFNYTNYQVLGSSNPKDNVLHLVDFVQNDYFTKNIVKNEKGIIVEEAKMGEDDPYTVMLFKHLDNIFYDYPYKDLITGSAKDVKKITLEDIKLVFNNFYHPENMFLVVTGNFNPYEILDALKENQKKKKFPKYLNPERIIPKENKKVRVEYEEVNINVTNKKIKIGLKMPKSDFKGYDDLHIRIIMSLILKANFGVTSDFRDYLLEKEIISNLSYTCDIFDDYVTVMFTIDSDLKEEIIDLFKEKLNNLEIDEKTFMRTKNANIATLILDYEDAEGVNNLIQSEVLSYGDIVPNLKEIYESITYKEVKDFLKHLNPKEQSILVLKPLDMDK